jgi:hypothetical protein
MSAVPAAVTENWTKFQTGLQSGINTGITGLNNLNIGPTLTQSTNKFTKGFNSNVQAAKEALGRVSAEEITELPQDYKDLEAKVDAVRQAHISLLKITRVYETETYDYPTQIQESIAEFSATLGSNITNFAATNLKGTNLPLPAPTEAPAVQHTTLPHALCRAAATAAVVLGTVSNDSKLNSAVTAYGMAFEKIAEARVLQDLAIQEKYLLPWQQSLNASLTVAIKARQAVRASRLELDAAKQALKTAPPAKQEAARLEVENGEDDLVQKTEVAIQLMKTVLDNPEPIKNLNELAKAQLAFHVATAEALTLAQGEIEELAVAAEGEYRKSRDH